MALALRSWLGDRRALRSAPARTSTPPESSRTTETAPNRKRRLRERDVLLAPARGELEARLACGLFDIRTRVEQRLFGLPAHRDVAGIAEFFVAIGQFLLAPLSGLSLTTLLRRLPKPPRLAPDIVRFVACHCRLGGAT